MKELADFEPLRPAEKRLVAWLQAGNRKDFVLSESVPHGPSDAVTLRATLIRYLALGGCDTCRLPNTGLRVWGAYIEGDEENSGGTKGLDLEGATLPYDLVLFNCQIPDTIILRSAKIKNLFLDGSDVKAEIRADRLQVDGGVFLREATIAGKVRLLGARLVGNLDCDGAKVKAKDMALICDGMQVEGSVFLRGATIAGKVRLLGARLGGDLSCIGANLQAKGYALHCDMMHAEGNVSLDRATIAGEVRLLGARLGGDLSCAGATLQAKGKALICGRAEITGAFFWRDVAKASGCVDLTSASFGSICDDPACWPPELLLDRCRYGAFLGASPTDAQSRLKWLALQQPRKYDNDFWPDPYEHCAKVLREMGHGADARKILIEKERLQRKARRDRIARDLAQARRDRDTTPRQDGLRLHTDRVMGHWLHLTGLRVWDGILGAVVGYGRKPQNAAWWGLAMWLIGFLVFANAAGHGAIKPNLPQIQLNPAWVDCADDRRGQLDCFLNHSDAASYPRFNAFIYSADTLIPVVSLEMQSYWIPDDSSNRGMLARGYLWFHIAMGWALTLLAVAGFSGLIKTDNTK